jgi:NAD-dependent dihydropyrimidine dehydrogenase PreA subunit
MASRNDLTKSNADNAPAEMKWDGKPHDELHTKWANVQDGHRHYAEESDGTSGGISVGVNGSACILCQACLIECEGECIHIIDDSGNKFQSIYK